MYKVCIMEQQTMIALVGNILYVIGTILVSASLRLRGDILAGNLIAMLVTIPIALYALNCSVVGNCLTYAWIYAYISVAVGILVIILGVYFLIFGPPYFESFGYGMHKKEHYGGGYGAHEKHEGYGGGYSMPGIREPYGAHEKHEGYGGGYSMPGIREPYGAHESFACGGMHDKK